MPYVPSPTTSQSIPVSGSDSIAIVGMACRLPGAPNYYALWDILSSGTATIGPIPPERWNIDRLYHADRKNPGTSVCRYAGLLDGIREFDAAFFGLSPREARALDPQQRFLLEETWHALEDAGMAAETLRGQRVGVYAAAMANDYLQHAASPFHAPDAYSTLGVYAALLANRISAFFGWRGESATVDTACASSLTALHQARLSLLNGTTDYCIVAAANALLSPWKTVSFSQAGMLSTDGLCKTFDGNADGYVPGEGAIALVLRRTSDALASGDRIHGLLLGTAINHMGPGNAITAPSVEAETEVVRAALAQARISPERISYVECHGTGTALGDPVEVEALARALSTGVSRNAKRPVLIGSVKSNLGHLEAAAGLAGAVKLLLMLRHRQIPPTINLTSDNPLLDFTALPLQPARTLTPWQDSPKIAGVSAFGFGGAGGHAILAEAPCPIPKKTCNTSVAEHPVTLTLSANDETALKNLAAEVATRLHQPDAPELPVWCKALALQRGSLKQRLAVTARSKTEAAAALRNPNLPIRSRTDTPPTVALRVYGGITDADWQAVHRQFPGLDRLRGELEVELKTAGIELAAPGISEFTGLRALLNLLRKSGVAPNIWHASGSARPAVLAAAGVADNREAAYLASYGKIEPSNFLRPAATYRDGDTGLVLQPVRIPSEALEKLLTHNASPELIEFGQDLSRGNYTFRAFLEEWRELLGSPAGEDLFRVPRPSALTLAVSSALWRTCSRWSLRIPSVALGWPAWPLAALAADGLIDRNLALDILENVRPVSDLMARLTDLSRRPETGRHPWLDQHRGYLPELDGLESPLAAPQTASTGDNADIVVVVGSPVPSANPYDKAGHMLYWHPADGGNALESLLTELWHRGLDVHQRALGIPRPNLELPLYPFNRKAYWINRLPEEDSTVLWETGRRYHQAGVAESGRVAELQTPETPQLQDSANATDWTERIRACVAATLEAEPQEIDIDRSLESQGIDSLISMDLATRIERDSGVKLSPAVIEALNSVAAIAEHIAQVSSKPDAVSLPQPDKSVRYTATARQVQAATPGLLDGIVVAERQLAAPDDGEVRVRIRAAGLNFRDLMIALDALPDACGEAIGLEFCGEIEAFGRDVKGIAVGDRVIGVGQGVLADLALTGAELVAAAPSQLNDAQCAALPIVYLTALRCLDGIESGQSILIHAAAGGLGQAAIRVAQQTGLHIFATAGSPEKRDWLQAQGIDHVMDSRSPDFADEIMRLTGGCGVDWLLNSLTGAAVDRGLDCLAQNGVFVEVGKTDIRDPQAIARQRPDIRYRVYDLVTEIRTEPEMIGRQLRALVAQIDNQTLTPLPVETFPLNQACVALQHMAKARHRGKIVLVPEEAQPSADPAGKGKALATGIPMAVVGMAGRFPGADDCEALWRLLETGNPALSKVPEGRWTQRELAACTPDASGRPRLAWGGFLADAELFAHTFFGFSPREARATDPRQRVLLEETWKALHAAGLPWNGPGDSLRDAGIGIFVAADAGDYAFKRTINGAKNDQLALAGNLPSSLAARLAHIFDCDGPALTIDLACSSSMGALWAAQQALAKGDCRYAVVSAVSLHATPLLTAQIAAASLLSEDGQCRSFTRMADGLVPAEACVSLILKPLARARDDGDGVLAVIESAAVGHDGQGSGFTLPSAASLAGIQTAVLRQAGLNAGQIDLISAHGVGTRGGDAAEITALAQTFASPKQPLPVTTLKPLLGHTFAAAGLSAVVHAILQLRNNRLLPAGLDESALIPEWNTERFRLPQNAEAWPPHPDGSPRRVLIETFAINGGQGSAIVAEAPADAHHPEHLGKSTPPLQRRRFWIDQMPAEKCGDNTPQESDITRRLRRELAAVLQEPADSLDLAAAPIELGLSSLLAIELQHRMQREFGVSLSLAQITGMKRLDELTALLATASVPEYADPVRDDTEPFAPFALTDLQSAYWSGRQRDIPLGGTDCQVYWEFECAKAWPAANLEAAWNRLVKLHPMLRAVVDANARQRILPDVPDYRFEILELSDLPTATAAERRQELRNRMSSIEIDPGNWPLFRIAFSTAGDSRRLHCAINLLVMDVLSLYSLFDQLVALADDPNLILAPPAVTFKQCLQAMSDHADGDATRAAEKFWSERALDLPSAPQLPMIKPLESLGRLSTRRLQARLAAAEWQGLCTAIHRQGLSQSVVLLAALAGALAHWTRKPRFTLNLTTHTRQPIHPEINQVVGNFTGSVLLDVDICPGEALHELATRIGGRLIEHLDHAHYPSVRIMRRRAATLGWSEGIMPVVFTSMLGYETLRQGHGSTSSLGVLEYGSTRTPQVTLDAQVQSDGAGLLLSWDVAEGIFPDGLPEAIFAAWVEAVAALNTEGGWERNIAAQITARETEVRTLANSATGPVPDEALFAPFLRQAQEHPDRIAIIAPERTLRYRELADICGDFAARLQALGVRPGELVAVAMDKGWRQIMAAIAVQMAGAGYLPLAPDLPPARFARLAERGRIRYGFTEAGRKLAWPAGVEKLSVDSEILPGGESYPAPAIDPDSLAYVIFTSGSTGEPKGVMLTHRAALNTCLDINRRFEIGSEDRVLALSALSFDLSVWDIFGPLAVGGALVLPKPASASDPAHLAALIQKHGVSVWNSVPMYLELFLAGQPTPENLIALRTVMLSGDWIALDLAARLRHLAPQARVHSLGGATEAAIWSIHYPIDDAPRPGWTSVPYGRALDNQDMHVLDAQLAPSPDFVTGDLYIGGIGLALGYWDDEQRTAAAFITHPANGKRLYRTGDLARWREDGLIEFLGRRDGQVKIDGFRVELGEIEAVLRTHPTVREAVAVAPADAQGRRRLAVFCTVNAPAVTTAELLDHLQVRLPVYMVPKELRLLESLPLTGNEKVDRRTLAEWAFRRETPPLAEPGDGQSTDAMEQRLLAIWESELNESGVAAGKLDPQRNLFEAGADSLAAVAAARRITEELGIACSVTEIFEHATVAALASALADRTPQPIKAPQTADSRPKPRADLRRAFRTRIG